MKKFVNLSLFIVTVAIFLLAGCGGGGGITPTATPTTAAVLSSKGYVYRADAAAVSGSRSASSRFVVLSDNKASRHGSARRQGS